MTYQEILHGIAQGAADLIEELFTLVPTHLTEDQFRDMAADLIAVARVRGSAAAEAAFRAFVEVATGTPYALPARPAPADRARLVVALSTILADDSLDVTPRLTVVKTTEPEGRKAGIIVGSVDELVAKLKEAGVV